MKKDADCKDAPPVGLRCPCCDHLVRTAGDVEGGDLVFSCDNCDWVWIP